MLFSSVVFVCAFFPLFFALYYVMPSRTAKNILLLVFSLIFYAWGKIVNLPLLIAAAFIGWAGGLAIDYFRRREMPVAVKTSLAVTVALLLGMLGAYKYLGFIAENINLLFGLDIAVPEIELPIGISFFTFQILSYVLDMYRKDVAAQKNFYIVAVYLCAFPQLIAGPVVRYSTVETELTEREVSLDDVYAGVRRFIVGLAKKVLIANTVATAADGIFSYDPASCGIVAAWIGALAYAVQIYFDFSGYSDMAIGMGRMMGFHYLENFDDPYTAVSVTDFWRRWHISMSTFFRDYVYIPLGGNRVSKPRWITNIFVVWALTGLWHGAAWNFVLWGVYFGALLVLEKLFWGKAIEKIPVARNLYTLLTVTVGWVLFRSETLADAMDRLYAMAGGYGLGTGKINYTIILERSNVGGMFIIAMAAGVVLSAGLGKWAAQKIDGITAAAKRSAVECVGCVLSFGLLLLSVASVASGAYNPFIYFQF